LIELKDGFQTRKKQTFWRGIVGAIPTQIIVNTRSIALGSLLHLQVRLFSRINIVL
jgi:hypothetical protein